jgi:uncharacterized protein YcgI (DUF1989 family)
MSVDPHLSGLAGAVVHDVIVPARAPWLHHVAAGQTLRIVDLEGNQAVDFLLYAAAMTMPSATAPRIRSRRRAICSCARVRCCARTKAGR